MLQSLCGRNPSIDILKKPLTQQENGQLQTSFILTILCNMMIFGPKFLLTVKMWINLRVNIM